MVRDQGCSAVPLLVRRLRIDCCVYACCSPTTAGSWGVAGPEGRVGAIGAPGSSGMSGLRSNPENSNPEPGTRNPKPVGWVSCNHETKFWTLTLCVLRVLQGPSRAAGGCRCSRCSRNTGGCGINRKRRDGWERWSEVHSLLALHAGLFPRGFEHKNAYMYVCVYCLYRLLPVSFHVIV